MDGLKKRYSLLDQGFGEGQEQVAEFLDEQEQDQIIEELRLQNERANSFFKKALAFVSLMMVILYLIFLYEIMTSSSNPIIPLPISEHIYSYAPYQMIATLSSIGALISSIFLLQAPNFTMIHIYVGAFLSIIPNIIAIHTEKMEKLWWAIPLGILVFDIIALFLIKDSEQDIRSLEKLKYKYKGA
ncbi:unnamed protein product [Rhizophagus irregularis]|nr:hypothetical protein RhiirC2_743888 [Rhizophagus irregularis]RGB26358.1 hypothetical protein C1646_721359 [Rhizophagus diaphanus] [Rhizophagus sp. MUCL 43196]GBC15707.2 hypothetical protein GLOIN_2v1502733 [Rhizophagus irregularis DAOM 181602=DAOM 197198]CAB4378531.1 unnamed protein product [Rhizophagus irregularis]CAB4479311.1 unnamed protein product [Rhizophagus irregularis]